VPPILPQTASTQAANLDLLTAILMAALLAVLALVFGLMLIYCVRYRASSDADRSGRLRKTWRLETAWTIATFVIFLGAFAWGADLYVGLHRQPKAGDDIFVVAKQWMWKVEHPGGQREIDELHIPVGRPVRLILASQDVIHSFYVPAFRVKQDVVPGRYEYLSFTPDKVGRFHLFCAEFCGTEHAHMGGWVTVMEPDDFARWLQQQGPGSSLAKDGEALFRQYGCSGCHSPGSTVHAPSLEGLYGRPVPLQDGSMTVANDAYLRDSILLPKRQVAAGYPAIMPSFAGQIGEEDLLRIIAYLKSIGTERGR
jgi:cytochrome c oxidase subunit 2